jgi:DNA polymerase III subunit delta'
MDRGDYYPWQAAERKRLVQQREADKMPHALLLSGARHLGKRDFALCMAGYLLCGTPVAGDPCGTCANCHLVAAGTHPDLRLIEPEGSKLIKIEQIRELTDWVNQTAQRGGFKVALIHPAEQMNLNAANALLKSLEEPSAGTVIILVSETPADDSQSLSACCVCSAILAGRNCLA